MEWMNRGIIRRRGVSKFLLLSARERAEQSPRDTFYRGRLGRPVCSSQHPVACALADASSTTLEIKLRRGAFFHAVLQKQATTDWPRLGGWTGCPCQNGPSPRLLLLLLAAEERGGSRLAQDSYFGGQIAEAKLLNCPHTLRHI